ECGGRSAACKLERRELELQRLPIGHRRKRQPDRGQLEQHRLGHVLGLAVSVIDPVNIGRRLQSMRAIKSRLTRPRPYQLSSGSLAIWTLNVILIACAAALFRAGAGTAPQLISSISVPFWALALGFGAAERFVVHIHFRRSAHTMSMG